MGMAEAVRRFESRSNPDVVRRLIARPIRLEHSRLVPPQPEPELLPEAPAETQPAISETEAETIVSVGAERDVELLEAELALLKAVLQAEREETAQLRARLSGPGTEAEMDVRAIRERWAALVDHLLLSRR
jgi:hypothetical protein